MFNKRVLKESTMPSLSGPVPGPESGVAGMLIEAINDEWNTINMYNDLVTTLTAEGITDMIPVFEDILVEENKHVGQLQELLKRVSPNANAISTGEQEAQTQLDDDVSWYSEN